MRSQPFQDPEMYAVLGPGSRRSAQIVVPLLMELLQPRSVIDFGSGTGAWLSAFRDAGVAEIVGLEAGTPDPCQLLIDTDCVRFADFEAAVDLGRRFDVAVSVEVAEHLPEAAAAQFVRSIGHHSDAVLFSAAIPAQGGADHLNEQWPTYWANLFAGDGFECFDPFRDRLWTDQRVEFWYRQNLLVFARAESALALAENGLRSGEPRQLVHPELYSRVIGDLRATQGIRSNARGLVTGISRRLRAGRAHSS